jgi:hypothetical protein
MKHHFYFLIFILLVGQGWAQQASFFSPVNIPIFLTGSFGELRGTHFHGGIDIRTNGQTGLPLFSADDGHVARISISPVGFGLALYIEHPNGYTTVYGHVEKFAPAIAKWVKEQQYAQKKFALDLKPPHGLLSVKRGEVIAWAGNTGSSGGPHLHYEIRNTATNRTLNPQLFGFKVADTRSPVINHLHLYPLGQNSHVDGATTKKRVKTVLVQGTYRTEKNQVIKAYGEIGFGVDVTDYLDGNWSKCGIYQLEVVFDSELVYGFSLDSLNYAISTHYNSHIDYAYRISGGVPIHKCFIEPGNRLEIYTARRNQGIVNIEKGKTHQVEINMKDVAGNQSVLKFTIQGTEPKERPSINPVRVFKYDTNNKFRDDDFSITLPEGALFDNLNFDYAAIDSVPAWAYSPIYKVHNSLTPLAIPVQIAIRTSKLLPHLTGKALLVKIDDKTGRYTSAGGAYKNGWVETSTRNLGLYCVAVDTTPPRIIPLSIKDNALIEANRIRFKISDNLSGIDQYNGYIDNEWVLFEYDAKSATIVYHFDEKLTRGKRHTFKLEVSDTKQNIATYEATFWK